MEWIWLKLRLPIGLRFLAAQIVAGDFAKPDRIFEIEPRADFVQPLEKSELLRGFLFEDRELIVGLRQRLDQLTPQAIRRLTAFDAIDERGGCAIWTPIRSRDRSSAEADWRTRASRERRRTTPVWTACSA